MGARAFNGGADDNDSAAGLEMVWRTFLEGEGGLYTYVAGTARYAQPRDDDIVTIAYDPSGNTTGFGWVRVYSGPADGDDVATAMVLDVGKFAVFVCGYTTHYVAGPGASSGGSTASFVPDTDYIVLGYHAASPGNPWTLWDGLPLPNTVGVRVWNGPGPNSNSSDDRAMDMTLTDTGNTDDRVWLTGHVREPDGLGYDIATISYVVYPLAAMPKDPTEEIWLDLPTTTEKGVALDSNVLDVYVAATIQPGSGGGDQPLMLTFKIKSFGSFPNPITFAFDWVRVFGNATSDIPAAIIAPTRNNTSVSVFVFGRSFYLSNSFDQAGVHYTQPPPP